MVDRGGGDGEGGEEVLQRSSTYTAAHRQGEGCLIWPQDTTHKFTCTYPHIWVHPFIRHLPFNGLFLVLTK